MHDITLKIALIGALGMAAQWLAWRLHLPAIVLLLLAGFAAGPATGILDPVRDFGEIYRPLVSMAVAVSVGVAVVALSRNLLAWG